MAQAATMGKQARALKIALGKHGIRHALNVRLANVGRISRQQDAALVTDYRSRYKSLEQTAEDNEKASGQQGYSAVANRGRERSNALSEALAQGAGESDVLRTQQMSLKAWNANMSEVARSYRDTLTSINSSLTDLTADTRTARINVASQSHADRSQLWTDYYAQRSETLTQLGNVRGQMAEFYGLANEAVPSKRARGGRARASGASGAAFRQASRVAGKAYKDPGVRSGLRNWRGAGAFEADNSISNQHETVTEVVAKGPEGATLRNWNEDE